MQLLLLALAMCCGQGSRVNEAVEARWRQEYPQAVGKLESELRGFWATGRSSYRAFSGTTGRTERFTIASSDDARLIKSEGRSSQRSNKTAMAHDGSRVLCETADYLFTLSRDEQATNYIINEYGPNRHDPESELTFWFPKSALVSTSYRGQTLLARMQDPSFKLVSADEVEFENRRLVRIAYEVSVRNGEESGTVQLDPLLGWAICKVDVQFNDVNGTKIEYQVEAKYTPAVTFLPSRFEGRFLTPNPDVYEEMIVEFDDVRPGTPSDSIFRLTAYGLPEIPLSPRPGMSFYTLRNPLFWASLSVAVVSFVLLRRVRCRTNSLTA